MAAVRPSPYDGSSQNQPDTVSHDASGCTGCCRAWVAPSASESSGKFAQFHLLHGNVASFWPCLETSLHACCDSYQAISRSHSFPFRHLPASPLHALLDSTLTVQPRTYTDINTHTVALVTMSNLCYNCGNCHLPVPCGAAIVYCDICGNYGHHWYFCHLGAITKQPYAVRLLV